MLIHCIFANILKPVATLVTAALIVL